jgi:hypothetical protein
MGVEAPHQIRAMRRKVADSSITDYPVGRERDPEN